jgi:hypothetical protein
MAEQPSWLEGELRELLERGTPRPPAPADRMARVREKVVRRRRRRAAGTAALTVAGVALAGTLVPGMLRDGGSRAPAPDLVPPAASRGAIPPAPTPESTMPGPGPTWARKQGTLFGETADVPGMANLLRTPQEWSTSVVPGWPAYAFAGSPGVRLPADGDPCGSRNNEYCAPVRAMDPGSALVALRALSGGEAAPDGDALRGRVSEVPAVDLSKPCRGLRGTRELVVQYDMGMSRATGERVSTPRSEDERYLEARACLADPSPQLVREAEAVLGSLDFGHRPDVPQNVKKTKVDK